MGFCYESLVRPILFKQDPETAHDLGTLALDYLSRAGGLCRWLAAHNIPAHTRPIELFGLKFPTAVGLAAGMDKNARFWRAAGALGFGHVEIGTVTLHKQPGNDKPRLFRYPQQRAVINRMGFNNDGAEAIAKRLKATKSVRSQFIPLGINIGKSKVAPLEEAVEDYLGSFHHLVDYADYITINVSSPNTPGLRRLQSADFLPTLLGELCKANRGRAKKLGVKACPLLLKIAPDLSFREVDDVLATIAALNLDGIVATNTTIARPGPFAQINETGGLSGRPLHFRSVEVVNYISRATEGRLPIIGVGGIEDPATAGRMMDAGASLVQLYTSMIYRGPFIAKEIAQALAPRHGYWV